MTKIEKLEKRIKESEKIIENFRYQNISIEMKLDAITEYFAVGYKVRVYEKIRGEEKRDLVISPVVRDKPCRKEIMDRILKIFKRTKKK